MLFINEILSDLSNLRPIFHSEADLQHALAWEIHHRFPESLIRLEYPPSKVDESMHLDIWCIIENIIYPIEVKYKTRLLDISWRGEHFYLLNQSAQDIARYDVIKDIERLEKIVEVYNDAIGYVVFLSNDSAYWKPPREMSSIDSDYRLHQDRVITGELRWGGAASKGTIKGKERPLIIRGNYRINWATYSKVAQIPYGEFRYLV